MHRRVRSASNCVAAVLVSLLSGAVSPAGTAERTGITVWIAGDSTVATGRSACPKGWGGVLAPFFDERITVLNRAVGGRSVRTWLYHVRTEMDGAEECVLERDASGAPTLQPRWQEMLDAMKPGDYLLIQFGINDGSPTCDRHVGTQAFKAEYGEMARAARDRGTQPIFITPVSALACNGDHARATDGRYARAALEAGAESGVPVLDLNAASAALYDALHFCPVPGGDVSATTTGPVGEFFCDDHRHFDDPGAPWIARLIVQALREQHMGLADHLK